MTVVFVKPTQGGSDIKNILIYGPPGTGKTTAAASAPGPIFYLNAEGESRLRYARRHHGSDKIREFPLTGRKSLEDAYLYLKKGGDGEKTIVVDSLAEMYAKILVDVAKDDLHVTLPEHGDTQTIMERFVRSIRDLPQNVVLIAHEETEQNKATGELLTRPSTLIGGRKLMPKIAAMMDVVGYAGVREKEDGAPEYVAQLVPAGGRVAKSSGPYLGSVRAMDLSEWIRAAAQSQATTRKAA